MAQVTSMASFLRLDLDNSSSRLSSPSKPTNFKNRNAAYSMDTKSSQCSLNFDILASVLPWIKERRGLFSFVSMCSALYHTGIPVTFLGFHCRTHANNLADFYEFLTSKSPYSFWGLRSLEFCFDPFEDRRLIGTDEICIGADILSRATKIRRLSISGDFMDGKP
ncbi:hypothetical protein EIP86_010694 [Pleurotus ostreatoroseus]|nr:hypothetical protein EIP86_010694 [Pleurotus ostreatoroseus]